MITPHSMVRKSFLSVHRSSMTPSKLSRPLLSFPSAPFVPFPLR